MTAQIQNHPLRDLVSAGVKWEVRLMTYEEFTAPVQPEGILLASYDTTGEADLAAEEWLAANNGSTLGPVQRRVARDSREDIAAQAEYDQQHGMGLQRGRERYRDTADRAHYYNSWMESFRVNGTPKNFRK